MDENDPRHHHLGFSTEEIHHICRGITGKDRSELFICEVDEELRQGLAFIKKHPKVVTILGSARIAEGDRYYELTREISFRLAQELGMAVATGGGPAIMEAGDRGAKEAGGVSLAMTIKLPHEQTTNIYATEVMHFNFFFTRKVIMTYGVEAFVYMPGGFGTLNEFFEILTLVQTKKTHPRPILLVGSEFWQPLQDYIEKFLDERNLVDDADTRMLYQIVDSAEDVVRTIRDFYAES